MIRINQISKRFGEKQVLKDFSMDIPQGVTCLMGTSGAGKTTLLRILLGLETPDHGTIDQLPRRIAVVFQEDRLTESMTVRSNLKLSLGRSYHEKEAESLLSELQLPGVLSQRVADLSGGMKRRVALCRALMYDAELLVLDEPFKGLDEATRRAAMDAVLYRADGKSILLVTHDEEEGRYMGANIVHLP